MNCSKSPFGTKTSCTGCSSLLWRCAAGNATVGTEKGEYDYTGTFVKQGQPIIPSLLAPPGTVQNSADVKCYVCNNTADSNLGFLKLVDGLITPTGSYATSTDSTASCTYGYACNGSGAVTWQALTRNMSYADAGLSTGINCYECSGDSTVGTNLNTCIPSALGSKGTYSTVADCQNATTCKVGYSCVGGSCVKSSGSATAGVTFDACKLDTVGQCGWNYGCYEQFVKYNGKCMGFDATEWNTSNLSFFNAATLVSVTDKLETAATTVSCATGNIVIISATWYNNDKSKSVDVTKKLQAYINKGARNSFTIPMNGYVAALGYDPFIGEVKKLSFTYKCVPNVVIYDSYNACLVDTNSDGVYSNAVDTMCLGEINSGVVNKKWWLVRLSDASDKFANILWRNETTATDFQTIFTSIGLPPGMHIYQAKNSGNAGHSWVNFVFQFFYKYTASLTLELNTTTQKPQLYYKTKLVIMAITDGSSPSGTGTKYYGESSWSGDTAIDHYTCPSFTNGFVGPTINAIKAEDGTIKTITKTGRTGISCDKNIYKTVGSSAVLLPTTYDLSPQQAQQDKWTREGTTTIVGDSANVYSVWMDNNAT